MDTAGLTGDLLTILLLRKIKKENKPKRNRRWWVRPINQDREKKGDFRRLINEMRLYDAEWFFTYTRMTPTLFESLLNMVGPHLTKNSIRKALHPSQRLAITLRFLSTGDSYFSIANGYHLGKSTVCTVIQEVLEVLWQVLQPIVMPEPTKEKLQEIDIVLLGVCDADYNFTFVDIGAYGSIGDGGVFAQSVFGRNLTNGSIPLPSSKELPGTTIKLNHFFVGDAAFPLRENLMRPYAGRKLNVVKSVFNYRLARARRIIENTFGIMVARWRIYLRTICAAPPTAINIVKATTCLHNFIRMSGPAKERYCPSNYIDSDDFLGKWRQEVEGSILETCSRLGTNNASFGANTMRNNLAKYFLTRAGFKKGQIEYVKRT
ncbi:uncharacterized protein LOC126891345 [Diabrotica virgifera virgifera]|uniref:DDE Tnp4 domain-containing protein n=1 Tax=Diabrotica virgifera virgifera TaxID=50390 RepID=A0ABM5L211_DIAVI|nr:uncharacterized protein LOC126891345 [Diabrotica virgifera virgifera]